MNDETIYLYIYIYVSWLTRNNLLAHRMTVEFSMSNNLTMVNRLIIVLGRKFCLSHNHNTRKGGLLGLAAVMVGFKNGSVSEPPPEMVEEVVRPILTCLLDSDSRVRYFACESLFNVTKVARHNVLPLFELLFDALSRLVADPDLSVRAGSESLDRILKDIVVESSDLGFDVEKFVTKLQEYIYTKNPFTRMFIISWIRILDMKIDMIDQLPKLLDGILNCLYDSTEEICASTLVLLSEFLATASLQHRQQQQHEQLPQTNFHKFIQALYKSFHQNDMMFEDRSKFIIVKLCSMTQPETVYRSLADIIKDEQNDLKFAYNLVKKLNQILLTAPALAGLRSRLSNCCLESTGTKDQGDSEMVSLFKSLLAAWAQAPIASVSLCLLTGNYKRARDLVMALAQKEITMEILIQVDWVVQLIESPVFASLRLRLLDTSSGTGKQHLQHQYLIQTLYGLLMILPQSEAYKKLSHRLDQAQKFINIQRGNTTSPS